MKWILMLLLAGPLNAMAANWGQVDYKNQKRQSVSVKIERRLEGKGRLTFTTEGKDQRQVELTRTQFSEVTAWLRFNFAKEARARLNHHEKSVKCEVEASFKATSGLTAVELCRANARQASLARQTAAFFNRF